MIVRIGEAHHRAKLTDHDVDLMRDLLDERRALITRCRAAGDGQGAIERALRDSGLSFASIAFKFEVSKSYVRAVDTWRIRQFAAPR